MAELASKLDARIPGTEKRLIDTLATVSSAVIAIGTLLNWFFGKQTAFPKWFFYILTLFILVILYKYFEDSIRRLIQTLSVRAYLRQQHFQLVDCLQRFNELTSPHGDDSIGLALKTIAERKGQDIVDRDLFVYSDQFVSNILLRMSDSGRHLSVGEFKGIMNDLTTLIKFSTHFYFKKPLHVTGIGDLSVEERKNIELARENFADFVRRYQKFYDEVNAKLGSSARGHFEIPKPLSY